MSRYFPELYRSSKDIKVEFGLTNYAMKFDIKKPGMHHHHHHHS